MDCRRFYSRRWSGAVNPGVRPGLKSDQNQRHNGQSNLQPLGTTLFGWNLTLPPLRRGPRAKSPYPCQNCQIEPVPLAGMVTLVAEIANSGVAHAETLAPINNQHKLKAIRREKGRPRRFMTNSSPPGRLNPA